MAESDPSPLIAMDVRMAHHSGIGRYIREVAPRVRGIIPEARWRWVGNACEDWMEVDSKTTEFAEWNLPIYSYREHLGTPDAFSDATIRWVPHYNVTPGGAARLVVTVHDVLPLRYALGWRGALRAAICRRYLDRIRRHARAVFANSQFTANELAAVARIDDARVRVTRLGCNRFNAKGAPAPTAKLNAASPALSQAGRGYFLFVGNIKPHKNLSGLLSAWSKVSDRIHENLVIVGQRQGFFTGDSAAARLAYSLGGRVAFTGRIPDEQLRALMGDATALVQPSFYEGFGLPVLEAMVAGCPVIASSAASLPEAGGDAALYFDPHDIGALAERLIQVSIDAALRDRMRAAGFEHAQRHTWDRTAELTAAALREVLNTR